MGKSKRPARSPLKVSVMFEGDRFASERLAMAYEQLVPLNTRATSRKKETTFSVASTSVRRRSHE